MSRRRRSLSSSSLSNKLGDNGRPTNMLLKLSSPIQIYSFVCTVGFHKRCSEEMNGIQECVEVIVVGDSTDEDMSFDLDFSSEDDEEVVIVKEFKKPKRMMERINGRVNAAASSSSCADTAVPMAFEVGGGGRWEDLGADLLGQIFCRIPADQVMRNVAFVCTSWTRAIFSKENPSWSQIDLHQWCRRVRSTDQIDVAIRKLVDLSAVTLTRVSACRIGHDSFFLTASKGEFLSVLRIPMSEVTDFALIRCAPSFPRLVVLDISYCLNVTHLGIEAIGKNCHSLTELRRNMPPPEPQAHPPEHGIFEVDEREATAVANTMSGLQCLEFRFGLFTDHALELIVTRCTSLHALDICGCWSVEIADMELQERCLAIDDFKSPHHHLREDMEMGSEETPQGCFVAC